MNLSTEEIHEQLVRFRNDSDVNELMVLYRSKSVSEILGVSRKELCHSSFLAWLLNPDETHELGAQPLIRFLEILVLLKSDFVKKYKEFFDNILVEGVSFSDIQVHVEKQIQNVGRPDLIIHFKVRYNNESKTVDLVIENKVSAYETDGQTERYYNYFEQRIENIRLYVYLTPISNLKLRALREPECVCKSFTQINYQHLLNHVIEPILKTKVSASIKNIIDDYALSLAIPSMNLDDNGTKPSNYLIMAINSRERELLTNFYKNHKKLIDSVMYAISIDEEQDEETREVANRFVQSSSRKRNTYKIIYENLEWKTVEGVANLPKSLLQLLKEKNLVNDEVFQMLRTDKSSQYQLLKTETETEAIEYSKKYPTDYTFEHNGEKYFVARNWSHEFAMKLVRKISDTMPLIQVEMVV